ncbi:MAG: hypothetical protein PHH40_03540 [Candidatus Moranbacteria bacterium]|nr:hypothetical protein [Candidatus Moranbacteria bacterium]MDD3964679.1 hypothetical protein [Candidatus Moranbacteria bacterium]
METPMETTDTCSTNGCPNCTKVAEESKQNEEMSLAFLLALVPVISLTFFGQMGLL